MKIKGTGKNPPKLGGEATKKRWLRQIDAHDGKHLSRKELAYILDVSPSKIRYDMEKERLEYVKLGPEGSHSMILIPKPDAKAYVNKFFTPTMDQTPPTKMLFPEEELKKCSK